jgi:hypothetical protein
MRIVWVNRRLVPAIGFLLMLRFASSLAAESAAPDRAVPTRMLPTSTFTRMVAIALRGGKQRKSFLKTETIAFSELMKVLDLTDWIFFISTT